jgi:hypothetical protein
MINNEIISFINNASAKGASREQIRAALTTEGGWASQDVEEAFHRIDAPKPTEKISAPEAKAKVFSDASVAPDARETTENKDETAEVLSPENDFVDLSALSFKDIAGGTSLSVTHPDVDKKSKIPTPLVLAFIVFAFIASFIIWPKGGVRVSPQIQEQQQRDMERMIQDSQPLQ